jgi:hypothetical protein
MAAFLRRLKNAHLTCRALVESRQECCLCFLAGGIERHRVHSLKPSALLSSDEIFFFTGTDIKPGMEWAHTYTPSIYATFCSGQHTRH